MSYAEDISKLRKRIQDAISIGIITNDNNKDFLEATLIQIMNDAEKNKQNCLSQIENLKKQIIIFESQASAFASVTNIVYNVINSYVLLAEKNEKELKDNEEQLNINNINS